MLPVGNALPCMQFDWYSNTFRKYDPQQWRLAIDPQLGLSTVMGLADSLDILRNISHMHTINILMLPVSSSIIGSAETAKIGRSAP
jgi:hypothetical protein